MFLYARNTTQVNLNNFHHTAQNIIGILLVTKYQFYLDFSACAVAVEEAMKA